MTDKLITFKTAKLAKEKRFNLNSPGFYSCDNPFSGIKGNQLVIRSWERWTNFGSEDSQEGTLIYSAPTQFILQKWLREKHNIDIVVKLWTGDVPNTKTYAADVLIFGTTTYIKCKRCESYEEALEIGLYEALKWVKE